ncbi:hypothetical protein [Nocardioides conyzicola]|uniref:Uncharacterized protein n=1 Tax=Nocardioides conyzicola TaxID=1651781 RepID=A0ABP8X888_9ACTN
MRVGRWLRAHPSDVVDYFVYVVVLNLAVEHLPRVLSEGFTLSLLTALLLKVALEVVLVVKARVVARFRAAQTPVGKVAAGLLVWVVAAGSKLVVLWLVDLVFGDRVSLGGFLSVTLLVVCLLLSRAGVRRLLDQPGTTTPGSRNGPPARA